VNYLRTYDLKGWQTLASNLALFAQQPDQSIMAMEEWRAISLHNSLDEKLKRQAQAQKQKR